MTKHCAWCKKTDTRATAIDIVEGDHVARKIYACAGCMTRDELVPLHGSATDGRPTSRSRTPSCEP
ncbi:hypothetical protein ACMATS_26825 [Streptoverticillium reticulum]|uniref:hypothetical protein n=1 Tax=Streptoverticillium reticulum TaxID=1433415 RepID=UPI0039BF295B